MRNALAMLLLLALAPAVCGGSPRSVQVDGGAQHWEASGVGFAPRTFDLKMSGDTVTGVIGQARLDPPTSISTTLVGPFEIYDGKISGNDIEFKAKTPDGLRIVTFQGVRNGNTISSSAVFR